MADVLEGVDALGLAARIRSGETTAHEAVTAAIARIEEGNGELNAIVTRCFETALDAANSAPHDGALAGVPFLVKDLGPELAGVRATRGSRLWVDAVPTQDSELVRRYRAAGLLILGMTNAPELGKNATTEPVLHGPTHNPWRLTHSPGGSSGGSAAAVASGMVPAAHGNDGGGSIRIPSSMCGLFGFKPSRGLVPSDPATNAFSSPLSIDHALTTTVRDSAVLLDVAAGAVPGTAYAAPHCGSFLAQVGADVGRLRIALSVGAPSGIAVDSGTAAAARRAAAVCESLGHHVDEVPFEVSAELGQAGSVIMAAGLAHAVGRRLAELGRELRDDDLEPFTQVMLQMGKTISAVDYAEALDTVERVGKHAGQFFERYDVLITPTMAVPVPVLGYLDTTVPQTIYERAGAFAAFTAPFNATGQPAMSIPFGTDSGGMPAGAQFVGRFGADEMLFRLAAQLELAAPWPRLAPRR